MIISEIISEAFREGNLKPVGIAATSGEATEALSRFNRLVRTLYGWALGENLSDWAVPPRRTAPVAAFYPLAPGASDLPDSVWPYPPCNVRLINSVTSATTIYLPQYPNDGARIGYADVGATAVLTIDANGRLIEGATTITAPSEASEWMYRGDLGNWQLVEALVSTDDSPFPAEFDDLMVCALSIALAPGFQKEVSEVTTLTYRTGKAKMKARYHQPTAQVGSGDLSPSAGDSVNLLE